ncbi:MAG: protein kinase [Woeseia sp.]
MSNDATKTSIGGGRILAEDSLVSDRYRIVRLIGVGGMGMVYLAHDQQLDIDVALKVLRNDGLPGEQSLERFRSELVLARQISHRNVIRIHDIGQAGDLNFISMDFVEGRSLKQVLETDGALPLADALSIATDIADALAEAHRNDIVHRDVKPANVLITADRAYLTDFGIARSMQSGGMTKTGEIVGTLDYLSPEQAMGKEIDGRSDIYALGLLLYEMLQGKRPFTGETAEEVLAQRTLGSPRDLDKIAKQTNPAVGRIVQRCLAVDPAARYQTADELAADLRAGGAAHRFSWRPKPLVIGAAIIAGVAAAGTWYVIADREAPAPQTELQITEAAPLAVLPFTIADSSGELDGFSQVLTELLGERLADSADLTVISSQRVASTLRDLQLRPDSLLPADRKLLGELLDADYLVTGRLQKLAESFSLIAQLQRAGSGETLYRAEVQVDSVARLFDGINELTELLRANLDAAPGAPLPEQKTVNPQALALYAEGVELLTSGNTQDAIEPLEAAVRSAPDFAQAWDRLALARAEAGRDRAAITASRRAVSALGDQGGRSAELIRARASAIDGDFASATTRLETLLKEYPADGEAQLMLAEIYGDAGRYQEAETVLQSLVRESPNHPQAWFLLGKFAILAGDSRRAADDFLVKALVVQNRLDNAKGRADALNALGIAYQGVGQFDEATRYYREALTLREAVGDERGVAAVLANLARIDLREGRGDAAREGLLAARDRLARIGDRWTTANLENELGFLEEQQGQFEKSLEHYREALRLRNDLGDQRALAESFNNVGYTYYLLGEYDNAVVFIDRSLATYRDTDNREGIMFASQSKGILEIARGRYDDALKALLESLQLSRELGDKQAEGIAEGYIGQARHLQGRFAAAAASFDAAMEKLKSLSDDPGVAEFSMLDAELSLDTGQYKRAEAAIEQARTLLEGDQNKARHALLLRVEGTWRDRMNEPEAAEKKLQESLVAAQASGERLAILKSRLALAASHARVDSSNDAQLAELRNIYEAAERMGHSLLRYEAGAALGHAYLAAGKISDAEEAIRETLQPPRGAAEYHRQFRLHLMLAELYEKEGAADAAATEWKQASVGVSAAMKMQNDAQRESFRELATVRLVLNHEEAEQ